MSIVSLHFEIKILHEGADLDKQDKGLSLWAEEVNFQNVNSEVHKFSSWRNQGAWKISCKVTWCLSREKGI